MGSSQILISSQTLSSNNTSVTFSSIPDTYTDLILRYSARTDGGGAVGDTCNITFNSDTELKYSRVSIRGTGAAVLTFKSSSTTSVNTHTSVNGSGGTSNTFANVELLITNYVSAATKTISVMNANEDNSTTAHIHAGASLYRNSSPITSITLSAPGSNFLIGSRFDLYGVSRVNAASVPNAPTIGAVTDAEVGSVASVAFTAPASGSAVDIYNAASSPGSKVGYGYYSPIKVPGLTYGTAYTFSVQGVNNAGSGTASSASSSLTPATPYWMALTGTAGGTTSEVGKGAAIDPDGNVYVVANGVVSGTSSLLLTKFTPAGTVSWARYIYGSGTATVANNGVVISPDNKYVYVTGYIGFYEGFIVKYDTSGTIQWQKKYGDGVAVDYHYQLAIDASSNLYSSVYSNASGSSGKKTKKINGSDGSVAWSRKIGTNLGANGRGAVAVDLSGNVYGVTEDGTGSWWQQIIMQYNSSGTLQWQKKLSRSGDVIFYALTVDSSNNVYGVGSVNFSGAEFLIVKFDSSGNVLWQRRLGNTSFQTYAYSVTTDSSNNVYVAGSSTAFQSTDVIIAKYDSSGTLQWQRRLGFGATPEVAYGIAIDSYGRVCVTGPSQASNSGGGFNDIFTAVLPANGSLTGSRFVGSFSASYEESTLTDQSLTLTETTTSLTNTDLTETVANSTFTTGSYNNIPNVVVAVS